MIKRLVIFVSVVFVGLGSINAQADQEHLKGLHKATEEELTSLTLMIGPETVIYDPDGKIVSQDDLMTYMEGGEYTLDPYLDEEGNFKLAVLRIMTEEEKEERGEIMVKKNLRGENELVGKAAPDIEVTDLKENKFKLSALKGKVVVLNFWFIACKPCVKEMPELNELVEKYSNEDVVFLALAIDDKKSLERFLKTQKFEYNIIPESMKESDKFGVISYPTHVIIDKEQKIVHMTSGLLPKTIPDLEREIEKQIKK